MKVGNLSPDSMATGHLNRLKQRNSLGPSRDTHNYAVVHCTGYIKNWPPTGQFDNHALSGTCQTLIFAFGDSFKEGSHKQVELDNSTVLTIDFLKNLKLKKHEPRIQQ